jgi:hypothetical protein
MAGESIAAVVAAKALPYQQPALRMSGCDNIRVGRDDQDARHSAVIAVVGQDLRDTRVGHAFEKEAQNQTLVSTRIASVGFGVSEWMSTTWAWTV